MKFRIIGCGREFRGDDALGLYVARRLKSLHPEWDIQETDTEGFSLLELWRGVDLVLLIDVVLSGNPPGTLFRWEAHRCPLPRDYRQSSSHGLGLAETIELARVLGQMPSQVIIVGLEGKQFEMGAPLSPEVLANLEKILQQIETEIGKERSNA